MEWMLLAGLGMLWAAFLLPAGGRRGSPTTSVEDFGRKMELLEQTERVSPGRWLLAPRKGEPFIGAAERGRARNRERRRRVFMVLLEAVGISFLIGVFPPLRGMWFVTGALAALLGLYCWLLVHLKNSDRVRRAMVTAPRVATNGHGPVESNGEGSAGGNGHTAPVSNGNPAAGPALDTNGTLGEDDLVHVIIRLPEELEAARP